MRALGAHLVLCVFALTSAADKREACRVVQVIPNLILFGLLVFFFCYISYMRAAVCPFSLLQAACLLRLSEAMTSRDIRHTLVQLVSVWRGDTVKALDQ